MILSDRGGRSDKISIKWKHHACITINQLNNVVVFLNGLHGLCLIGGGGERNKAPSKGVI